MRVGIDTGEMVVTGLADRSSGEFLVVGETANRAARLQTAARPGTVLLSADTTRQVRGEFGLRRIRGLELKGIDGPVDAFVVVAGESEGYWPETRGVEGVVTRTIGREQQLRQLQDAFAAVVSERARRIVTVVGRGRRRQVPAGPRRRHLAGPAADRGLGAARPRLPVDRERAERAAAQRVRRAARHPGDRRPGPGPPALARGLGPAARHRGAHGRRPGDGRRLARVRDRRGGARGRRHHRPRVAAAPGERAWRCGCSTGSPSGRRSSCSWRTCTGPTPRAWSRWRRSPRRPAAARCWSSPPPGRRCWSSGRPGAGPGRCTRGCSSIRCPRTTPGTWSTEILQRADDVPPSLVDLVVAHRRRQPVLRRGTGQVARRGGGRRHQRRPLAGGGAGRPHGAGAHHPARTAAGPPRLPRAGRAHRDRRRRRRRPDLLGPGGRPARHHASRAHPGERARGAHRARGDLPAAALDRLRQPRVLLPARPHARRRLRGRAALGPPGPPRPGRRSGWRRPSTSASGPTSTRRRWPTTTRRPGTRPPPPAGTCAPASTPPGSFAGDDALRLFARARGPRPEGRAGAVGRRAARPGGGARPHGAARGPAGHAGRTGHRGRPRPGTAGAGPARRGPLAVLPRRVPGRAPGRRGGRRPRPAARTGPIWSPTR